MIVTVIIPVYNEEKTIIKILKKVNIQKKFFNLQIIVSNDGSNDKTINLLKKHKDLFDLLINSKKNYGKGKVFYISLGHDPNEFKRYKEAWELLTRGFIWASSN